MLVPDTGKEDPKVIVYLGDGAYGGSRVFAGGLLFDGYGGRQAPDHVWLPIGGLLAALLTLAGAFSWLEAIAVALPLSGLYAFVCLASYHLCRTVPLRLSSLAGLAGNVLGAAAISASLWVLAGRGWVGLLAWLARRRAGVTLGGPSGVA